MSSLSKWVMEVWQVVGGAWSIPTTLNNNNNTLCGTCIME